MGLLHASIVELRRLHVREHVVRLLDAKAIILEALRLGGLGSSIEGRLPLGLRWLAGSTTKVSKLVKARLLLVRLLLLHSAIEKLRLEAGSARGLTHRLLLLLVQHLLHLLHLHGGRLLGGLLRHLWHLACLGRSRLLLALAVEVGHRFESRIFGSCRHVVLLPHH